MQDETPGISIKRFAKGEFSADFLSVKEAEPRCISTSSSTTYFNAFGLGVNSRRISTLFFSIRSPLAAAERYLPIPCKTLFFQNGRQEIHLGVFSTKGIPMKILLTLLLCFSPPAMAKTEKVKETPLPNGLVVHEYTMDNGMRLLLVPDHSAPVFTYQVWFRVGSEVEKMDPQLKRTGL